MLSPTTSALAIHCSLVCLFEYEYRLTPEYEYELFRTGAVRITEEPEERQIRSLDLA